jgi:uncharacterized membrane protein
LAALVWSAKITLMDVLLSMLIIVVAAGGFSTAFYIGSKKQRSEKLVCPLDSDCDLVIHSPYSIFWGVPLERWGMAYYAIVILLYTLFLTWPGFRALGLLSAVYWLSILAFLVSAYLIYIQAAKLRQWCTWCLLSGVFCTVIFLTTLALI